MLVGLRSRPGKAIAILLAGAGVCGLTSVILARAYVGWHLSLATPESLHRVLAVDPDNCEAHAKLGFYYSFSLSPKEMNPERGEQFLRRATRCQPLNPTYWLTLATALQAGGRTEESAVAALKAVALDGHNSITLWRSANLLLLAGRTQEAFDAFHRVLEGAPEYAQKVFSLCWKASDSGSEILRRAVPDTVDMNVAYLNFLASPADPKLDDAQQVWDRLLFLGRKFSASKTFPYFDALIRSGRTGTALKAWNQLVLAGILPKEAGHTVKNTIVNGGYEVEPANGGFDWRIRPSPGVETGLDARVRHTGARSLVTHFKGLTNVDYRHLTQVVAVQPRASYDFRVFTKSQALSTLSGPYFELADPHDPTNLHWETSQVLGTTEWTESTLRIRTGPKTRLLTVTLRRRPAVELAKRIEGTLWVDDVELTPHDQGY